MKPRILVVEDDHLQQSILQSALQESGYDVDTASDGLSAVWRIREGSYDLVLLDYQLPEMDGLATANLVRDLMGQAARPCLIALTALPDCVLGRELLAGRAFDGVIGKSISVPELLATVTRYLRSAPSGAARRQAEIDLTMKEWGEFETMPDQRVPGRRDNAPARILVVEDDDMQRSVVKAALDAEEYDVETAFDGLSAVRKIRFGSYDLALIDYELPEIDGLATAKLISTLVAIAVRPRLVGLTSAPDMLTIRAVQSDRVFDHILGKQEGLPAMLASVKHQLQPRPERTT